MMFRGELRVQLRSGVLLKVTDGQASQRTSQTLIAKSQKTGRSEFESFDDLMWILEVST